MQSDSYLRVKVRLAKFNTILQKTKPSIFILLYSWQKPNLLDLLQVSFYSLHLFVGFVLGAVGSDADQTQDLTHKLKQTL